MSNESLKSKTERLCSFCDDNPSKYCCPRCELFYCSLNCYKSEKHSECSESFYRDCINEELASHQVDDDSKKKMMDILKRMHEGMEEEADNVEDNEDVEEIDSDDGSDIDLHTRIKDLNLDDPDSLWNALTEDERNEFEAIISGGDVGSIIPEWEPWWLFRKEKKLLEEINIKPKESNVEDEILTRCPDIKAVPKFGSLTSTKPSEAIKYNMTNVLASYAFTARYFNGDIEPVEAATYLLDISSNLNSNANYEDSEIAVESVVQRCLQSEYIQTDKASLDVMRNDVCLILQGPSDKNNLYYSKAAFSHLIQIFSSAKSKYSGKAKNQSPKMNEFEFSKKFPEHKSDHLPELDVSKLRKVIKKLEYYLSFLNSCDNKDNN